MIIELGWQIEASFFGPSVKGFLKKNFLIFHLNLSKLGKVFVHLDKYNFTNLHQIQMKNKKVFSMTHLTDSQFVKGR